MKEIKELIIGKYKYFVIGISVMGKKKTENQDCFLIEYNNSSLSVVVADGLGSAPFSKEGASKICYLCQDFLRGNIEDETVLKLKEDWKTSVKSDFDKYDTTVKFIKIDDNELLCGGVGDGWICVSNDSDVASFEASHTFSNQTDSILSIDLLSKFIVKRLGLTGELVALISTDGFSEDINKKDALDLLKDIKDSINADVYDFANEMENTIKNWPVETNCDDKTVVFVLRKEISR